ncbi:virulence associated protein B [Beggiatoa sp. PS]|nr:virulence associated protein B [Beggiatoa sp. PS]
MQDIHLHRVENVKSVVIQKGKTQWVELPNAFHLNGQEVFIKSIGNAIVLIPSDNPWQSLFDSLEQFSDDFMDEREQPKQQLREAF